MIRLIESSSAQLRLERSARVRARRTPRAATCGSSARRAARSTISRAIDRRRSGRDDRPASLQPRRSSPRGWPRRSSRRRDSRPVTYLGSEAVAARADVRRAARGGARATSRPWRRRRAFRARSRARCRNCGSRRSTPIASARCRSAGAISPSLLERFDEQFAAAQRDRSRDAVRRRDAGADAAGAGVRLPAPPALLLLDVPIDSRGRVRRSSRAARSHRACAAGTGCSSPSRSATSRRWIGCKSLGLEREVLEQTGDTDLVALRRYLFADRSRRSASPPATCGSSRRRRRTRVRRDRAPHPPGGARAACRSTRWRCSCARRERYVGLLEHALRARGAAIAARGSIAARAARIPPAARSSRFSPAPCEHLSARRFAEYLSLGQVPRLDEAAARAASSSLPRRRGTGAAGARIEPTADAASEDAGRRTADAPTSASDRLRRRRRSSRARCARRGSGRR